MDPIQIKKYLKFRKIAPLQDIAIHFRKEPDALRPMLDMWIHKGKVKRTRCASACQKGCCKCDPATLEVYEWIG